MRWLAENWVWIVVGGGMIWMHLGHGGMHGNHGSHGSRGGHRTNESHEDRGHADPDRSRPHHPGASDDTSSSTPRSVRQPADP